MFSHLKVQESQFNCNVCYVFSCCCWLSHCFKWSKLIEIPVHPSACGGTIPRTTEETRKPQKKTMPITSSQNAVASDINNCKISLLSSAKDCEPFLPLAQDTHALCSYLPRMPCATVTFGVTRLSYIIYAFEPHQSSRQPNWDLGF